METRDIRDLDVAVLEAQVAEFYRAEVAHRQEIQRLTQERDKYRNGFASSQEQIGLLLAERDAFAAQLAATTAERDAYDDRLDALAAHVATLREALQQALGVLIGPYCEADEATIVAVEAALAATEGGSHE